MVTELDIFGITERIVNILDSDTDLYDATGASGKVRKIEAGAPDLVKLSRETVLPHIFVTISQDFETINPVSVISNAWKSLNHTVDFEIYLYVDGKDGPKAEESLLDFRKLIYETLEENNQLEDPDNPGTDPKVATSWPFRTRIQNRGDSKQQMIITFRCKMTT